MKAIAESLTLWVWDLPWLGGSHGSEQSLICVLGSTFYWEMIRHRGGRLGLLFCVLTEMNLIYTQIIQLYTKTSVHIYNQNTVFQN